MDFKPCIIIPVFRHISQLSSSIEAIKLNQIDIFLIDDGNEYSDKNELVEISKIYQLSLISHSVNLGKGAAIKTGLIEASKHGFTHALQIDADGQHNSNDIPKFLNTAKAKPQSLILGSPVFDYSAPKSRVYGRKITTAILMIETFSTKVKDALFGFRVYPIASTLRVIENSNTSDGMGFDPEIVVRLCWAKIDIINIPSKVIYPTNGFSNFDYLTDNIKFILLHSKLLCLGAINIFKTNNPASQNWSTKTEHGTIFSLKIVLILYKFFGKNFLKILLYPVIAYFFLKDKIARDSSLQYLNLVHEKAPSKFPLPNHYLVFKHFYRFGLKIISSIQAWIGDIPPTSIDWHNKEVIYELVDKKQGGLIIGAHFGCLEVCRAIQHTKKGLNIVPIMYLKNAKVFRTFLKQINPNSSQEVIEIENIHPGVAIEIKQRIDSGQFISILADRVLNKARSIKIKFFNKDAYVPEGPFALAFSLECPVISFISYFDSSLGKYQVYIKKIEVKPVTSRQEKRDAINQIASDFYRELERHCLTEPLEWFNFFPFWSPDNEKKV